MNDEAWQKALDKDRHEMWMNFLDACNLAAVVLDTNRVVWQKRGSYEWKRVGSSRKYSADEIAWPVERLHHGIA